MGAIKTTEFAKPEIVIEVKSPHCRCISGNAGKRY